MDLPDSVYETGAETAFQMLARIGVFMTDKDTALFARDFIDAVKDKIGQWGYVAGHEDGWQEGYSEGLKVGQREKKNDPA